MPKIPAPIKAITKPIATLAKSVGKNVTHYAEHQQAKHEAAQTVTLDDGQKAFNLGSLALWAKDLELKGDGYFKRVRVGKSRLGDQEFLTTKKNSFASLVARKQLLPSQESGMRMKATLNSERVQELVAADKTLEVHKQVLLEGLGKEGSPATQGLGIDTRRQEAIIALGIAHLGDKAPEALKATYEALKNRREKIEAYRAAVAREKELADLLQVVEGLEPDPVEKGSPDTRR